MTQPTRRDPPDAGASAGHADPHHKIPEQRHDSTAGGDARSDVGEDNHRAKKGEQTAEDFIRR